MKNQLVHNYDKFLTITFVILVISVTSAQFSPEIIISNQAKGFSKITQINDTISVGLNENGVFALKNNHLSEKISVKKIPGSSSISHDIVVMDYDKDGDKDFWIINESPSGSSQRFDNINGNFENMVQIGAFPNQSEFVFDYNQDGIDDFMHNNSIYVWTGDSYEIVAELSPSSGVFNSIDAIDLNKDGYMDLLRRASGNLFYYESNQNGGFSQNLVNDQQETIRWVDVINTPTGRMAVIHNSSGNIEKLEIVDNSYLFKEILSDQVSLFANQLFDLDKDGYEEIVCNFISSATVLQYDHELDTLHLTRNFLEDALPNHDQLLVQNYNDNFYLVTSANSVVKNYLIQDNFTLEKESGYSLALNTHPTLNFNDVDGDGFVDIGTVNNLFVMRYLGSNKFGPLQYLEFADGSGCFQDFDQDGDNDYIKNSTWLENLGDLVFSDEKEITTSETCNLTQESTDYSKDEIMADFDGNGVNQILKYNKESNQLRLGFSTLLDLDNTGKNLIYLRALDINLDGSEDIIFATEEVAMILLNKGQSNEFEDPILIDEEEFEIVNLEVVKMNNDDSYELITSTHKLVAGNSHGYVRVHSFENNEKVFRYSHWGGNSSGNHIGRSGDFNLDGIIDLMIYRRDKLFAVIFDNNFNDTNIILSNNLIRGFDFRLKDLNSDGDLDVITMCYDCQAPIPFEDDRYSYFLNNHIVDSVIEETECFIGDVTFANQQDVDEFYSQFGECTTAIGNINIGRANGGDWPDIENINSLINLKHLDGNLTIEWVNKMNSLSGLDGLESISGNLSMLNYINGSLVGLDNVKQIGGNLFFFNVRTNESFTNPPFSKLEKIEGNIEIENYSAPMLSLPSLESEFNGNIILRRTSLSPAQFTNKIKRCHGSINILSCQNLSSSFRNLSYVSHDLNISGNNGSFNFSDLQEDLIIDSVLYIRNNPDLTYCNIKPFCDHLESNKPAEIYNNGEGCEQEDISCAGNNLNFQDSNLVFWPQPANDEMFVIYNYNNEVEFPIKYNILNMNGIIVQEDDLINNSKIDISTLENGLYIINVLPQESDSNYLESSKFLILR